METHSREFCCQDTNMAQHAINNSSLENNAPNVFIRTKLPQGVDWRLISWQECGRSGPQIKLNLGSIWQPLIILNSKTKKGLITISPNSTRGHPKFGLGTSVLRNQLYRSFLFVFFFTILINDCINEILIPRVTKLNTVMDINTIANEAANNTTHIKKHVTTA